MKERNQWEKFRIHQVVEHFIINPPQNGRLMTQVDLIRNYFIRNFVVVHCIYIIEGGSGGSKIFKEKFTLKAFENFDTDNYCTLDH